MGHRLRDGFTFIKPLSSSAIVAAGWGVAGALRVTEASLLAFIFLHHLINTLGDAATVASTMGTLRLRPEKLGVVCVLNPTCIRRRKNLLSEETFQSGHISIPRGSDKRFQKTPLLSRTDRIAPAIGDMLTGTGDELAGACFLYLQDACDLAVGVIERFAQNICGALCGREFFKQHEYSELQSFTVLCA